MARLAGRIPINAGFSGSSTTELARTPLGGGLRRAIFLLSVCQTKVRVHIRGVRWRSTEVGSLFRQEMGWKTSGFQFLGGVGVRARACVCGIKGGGSDIIEKERKGRKVGD